MCVAASCAPMCAVMCTCMDDFSSRSRFAPAICLTSILLSHFAPCYDMT